MKKKSALGYLHSSEPAEKNHDDLSGVTESVLQISNSSTLLRHIRYAHLESKIRN